MDLKLTGKTALVTAATAGIGLAIARALAAEGAHLVVTGRDRGTIDAVADELGALAGVPARGLLADAATAAGAEAIAREEPAVDILVNNLGIYEVRAFSDIADADWMHMFEANVMSGVRLARSHLAGMIERGWGRIVFISSESGLAVPADMIHYATTKAAQLAVSRGLAQLTRGTGVTVNAVLPGPTRSAGVEDLLRARARDTGASLPEVEAEFFATARPASILGRFLEAEEVAHLVTYLASPLSSATNGAALRAEGGLVNTIA